MPTLLRSAIATRKPLIGTLISTYSCELVEALSIIGIDWLFFDMEHSSLSLADVQHMIQAVRRPCLSFIRIEQPEAVYVKRAMDTGCDGIIVPQVNSAETARLVVDAGKYAPAGNRSVGLGRSSSYGVALANAVAKDNDEKSIVVQIEHAKAVENLDAILGVPGIDGIFVGPYDLSSSMGLIGEVRHQRVQDAIGRIAAAAQAQDVPMGIFVGNDEMLEIESKKGFQFIAVGADILRVVASARATLAARDKLAIG